MRLFSDFAFVNEEKGVVLGNFEDALFEGVVRFAGGGGEQDGTGMGEGDKGGVMGKCFKAVVEAGNSEGNGGSVVDDGFGCGKREVKRGTLNHTAALLLLSASSVSLR